MNQHVQQSMPAHLKKYVGSGHGYIPQHAERAIAQQMQKTMPAHLKQYAGAYMQQNIIQPNSARPAVMPAAPRTTPHPPMPDKLRRGHSMPYGEQHTVELNSLPNDQSLFQAEQPPQGPNHPAYDFILNPGQPPPRRSWLPAGASAATRALIVAGIVGVLLIGFAVLRNILSSKPGVDSFISIAQDQQELIHLVGNASGQDDLSSENQNFVATAGLSLDSSQGDLIEFLGKNHQKLDLKSLNLKINRTTDEQLAFAATSGTYNSTFQEVMTARLHLYVHDLEQAFSTSKSQAGRALLSDDYKQAKLLLKQLSAANPAN